MRNLKTYKDKWNRKWVFLVLVLVQMACSHPQTSKSLVLNFNSIQHDNELILFQTDDKFGEWGGDTYYLKMYRDDTSNQLKMDYAEYEGQAGPPAPPDPNSKEKINWFSGQTVKFEKKNIEVTPEYLSLISNCISELTKAKINNDAFISMSGIVNQVMCSDSSLYIHDYSSYNWNEFREFTEKIRQN